MLKVRQWIPIEEKEQLERRCKTNLWNGKIDRLNNNDQDLYHQCLRGDAGCNPENETRLLSQHRLTRKELTGMDHIFLCDKGIMHVCSEDECNLWSDRGTCPISGFVHGIIFKTGRGRSGHYLRGKNQFNTEKALSYSAHSTKREGYYINGYREKRSLATSMPSMNLINEENSNNKTKRVKLLSSGNIFRKSGSCTVTIEKPKVEKSKTKNGDSSLANGSLPKLARLSDTRIKPIFSNDDESVTIKVEKPSKITSDVTTKRRGRKKGSRREISEPMRERFKKNVEGLIHCLFFSRARARLNEKAQVDAKKEWEKKYRQYQKGVESCGKEQTYIEKYEIALNTQVTQPFVILPNNGILIAKYFSVVRHVWDIVCKYGAGSFCNAGPRVCIQITLGTLYSMRNSGVVVNNINYLPQNPELLDLPPLPTLHHFQESKLANVSYNRSFTTGANAILDSYQNAVMQGVSVSELILDTNTINPETVTIDGKQVHEKLFKVISRPAEALAQTWETHFPHLEKEDIYDQIIRDRAHLKNGDKKRCLENLVKLDDEKKKIIEETIKEMKSRFPEIQEEDVRFSAVLNVAWKDRESYARCIEELEFSKIK